MIKRFLNLFDVTIMVVSVLMFFTGGMVSAESLQSITNLWDFFSFPHKGKDNWFTIQVINNPEKGISAFVFGRKGIPLLF